MARSGFQGFLPTSPPEIQLELILSVVKRTGMRPFNYNPSKGLSIFFRALTRLPEEWEIPIVHLECED